VARADWRCTGRCRAAVRDAGHQSFVDGLHLALWVAAACMIGCAVLVARLTRPEPVATGPGPRRR
jgi:hypothetical protein